jgi:hypothetical protein
MFFQAFYGWTSAEAVWLTATTKCREDRTFLPLKHFHAGGLKICAIAEQLCRERKQND